MPRWLPALVRVVGIVAVVLLLAARFVNLKADFPNHTYWADDHAKFSDEGWYANAAMNSVLWGHWYIPGDWAPAVVVPAWPALLDAEFHVTGISVVAARATEVCFAALALLLCTAIFRRYYGSGAALALLFLGAASVSGYMFSRVAILERPFEFLVVVCIAVALWLKHESVVQPVLLGALAVLMILTKTTGVFVLPAILYPIWFHTRHDWRKAAKPIVIVVLTIAVLLAAERFFFVRHYAADTRAFFAQSEPKLLLFQTLRKGVRAIFRGTWVDPILWPVACVGVLASLWMRDLWKQVLWGVSVLWIAGYTAFIVYHFDGPPRYFTVMLLPTLMIALMFALELRKQNRATAWIVVGLCIISGGWNFWHVQGYVRHPEYTMLHATDSVRAIIDAHPETPRLMIGHAANETTLYTAIPSLDDSFGTISVQEKMNRYNPGWFLIWSDESPSDIAVVARTRSMVPLANIPAMDDKVRSHLMLFQLKPLAHAAN